MTTPRHLAFALVPALAALCSGCSFAFVRGPASPTAQRGAAPDDGCGQSAMAAPIADLVATGALLALGTKAAGVGCSEEGLGCDVTAPTRSSVKSAGVAFIGAGVVTLASSVYGFVQVQRCHQRAAEQAEPEVATLEVDRAIAAAPPAPSLPPFGPGTCN